MINNFWKAKPAISNYYSLFDKMGKGMFTVFIDNMEMYRPECLCPIILNTIQATIPQPNMIIRADAQILAASSNTIVLPVIEVKAKAGKPI